MGISQRGVSSTIVLALLCTACTPQDKASPPVAAMTMTKAEPGEHAAETKWQRSLECSDRVNRFGERMKQDNKPSGGAAPFDWSSHYDTKRQQCFGEFHFFGRKEKQEPLTFVQVYDVVENGLMAAWTQERLLASPQDAGAYCKMGNPQQRTIDTAPSCAAAQQTSLALMTE